MALHKEKKEASTSNREAHVSGTQTVPARSKNSGEMTKILKCFICNRKKNNK